MLSSKNNKSAEKFTLWVPGLVVENEQKTGLEAAADDLTEKIDKIGHLDPLDPEPAIGFDPTC